MLFRSQPMDLADLNVRGYVAPVGPLVVDYDASRLLITLARSLDGSSLELTLEPTGVPVEGARLALSQLASGSTYDLCDANGAVVATTVAQADGTGSLVLPTLGGPASYVLGQRA